MSEHQGELKELKQEVAELWVRFRAEQPGVPEDEARRALAAQAKALESRRRALSDRRSVLERQLDVAGRRASRWAPVLRFLGGVAGAVAGVALGLPLVPAVAARAVDLGELQGAAVLTGSLLLLAIARAPGAR
jgi:hypothetical protein